MNAKIATAALLATVAVTAAAAIYYDSNAASLNWTLGNHAVSYAVFPEILMIGAVSMWVGYLFDWKFGLLLATLLAIILFAETQTYIGNDFWNLFHFN